MPSRASCRPCRAFNDSAAEPALSHHKDSIQQQQRQLDESASNGTWSTVDRRKNRKATVSGSNPAQHMPNGHSQQMSVEGWSSGSEDLPLPGLHPLPDQVHSESADCLDHSITVESNDNDSTAAAAAIFNSGSIATKQTGWDTDTGIVAGTWNGAEDAAISFPTEVEQCKWCSSVAHDSENCPQQNCEHCEQLGHHTTRCKDRQQQAALQPAPEPDYSGKLCRYCHQVGHIKLSCPQLLCHNCGQYGHRSSRCMVRRGESQAASHRISTAWEMRSSHTAGAPQSSRAAESTAAISSPCLPTKQQQHSASSRPQYLSAPGQSHRSSLQHAAMAPCASPKLVAQPAKGSSALHVNELVPEIDFRPPQVADDLLEPLPPESPAQKAGSQNGIIKPAAKAWADRPGQQLAHVLEQQHGLTTSPEHTQRAREQTTEQQATIPGLKNSLGNPARSFQQQGFHAPVPQQAQVQPDFMDVPGQDKLCKQVSEDGWDESKADAPFAPLPDFMPSAAPIPRSSPNSAGCSPAQLISPARSLDDVSLPSPWSAWQDNIDCSTPVPARTLTSGHPALPHCVIQPGMGAPSCPPLLPPTCLAPPGIRPGSRHGARGHHASLHRSMPYVQQRSHGSQLDPPVPAPSTRSTPPQPPSYDLQQQPEYDPAAPRRAYVQQETQPAVPYSSPSASTHAQSSIYVGQHRLPAPNNTQASRQAFSSPIPANAAVEATHSASAGLIQRSLPGSAGGS